MATAAATHVPSYPVHVDARPVPDRPSRGLWLVKWVLVVPHVLVLAFLWAAFVVLSVVALVAILATGRYPRGIFDFNVGVLRWTWRVAYYSYGALGTDRYPPFTLAEDPDYPAHLAVDYPERLSRGLVLVKWWLLVLPHYLLLMLFAGAGAEAARRVDGLQWVWDGGLIALLALIAGLALLVTGRYPRGLYDLLLGLNRWVLRVAAYAGLLTDAYPPFRLDQGGPETLTFSAGALPLAGAFAPAPAQGRAAPAPSAPRSAPPRATTSWTGGRVVAVVAGSVAVLLGVAGVAGGIPLVVWQSSLREDGYVTTPTWEVATAGYAAVTDELVLEGAWLDAGLGDVRLRAVSDGGDIFLGVATPQDAAAYLDGVARTERSSALSEDDVPGGAPAVPPADAGLWIASASGPGPLEIELEPAQGRFVAVVMASDGRAGVDAALDVGATLPWLAAAGAVLLSGGILLLGLGVVGTALAVRFASRGREVGSP